VANKGKLTFTRLTPPSTAGCLSIPERIQSQIEGAAIMGLSLAKYGEITFKDGKVQQGILTTSLWSNRRGTPRDQRAHRARRPR